MEASSDDTEEPIIELATECEKLFFEQVSRLKRDGELHGAKVLGEYQQRFAAWASFLGVFAGPKVCLDRRLRRHPDLQELALRLLEILERNLFHLLDSSHDSPDKDTDRREPPERKHPQITPNSLDAIAEAISRLDHLGKAIRQSPATNQAIRAKRYAKLFDLRSFEEASFAALKTLYPEATQTLLEQLSQSMVETYAQFRYRQSRQEPLQARRHPQLHLSTIPEGDGEEHSETLETGIPNSSERKQRLQPTIQHPGDAVDSEYAPTSLDSQEARNKWRRQSTNHPRDRNTKSVVSRQVDYPRAVNNGLACEWCFAPISEEYTEEENWRQHINEDHKPYVCISENCAESLPRYASSSEWLQHMVNTHGRSWHRNIHLPFSWVCPLCDGETICQKQEHLVDHINDCHVWLFTETQVEAVVQHSKLAVSQPSDVCPLCWMLMTNNEETSSRKRGAHALLRESSSMLTVRGDSSKRIKTSGGYSPLGRHEPDGPQSVLEQEQSAYLTDRSTADANTEEAWKHIAGHLQSIMLLTLRLISVDVNKDVSNKAEGAIAESDAESPLASMNQAYSHLDKNDMPDIESSIHLPDDISMDDVSSISSLNEVPDAQNDWSGIALCNEAPPEVDNFLKEIIASGAFQSHEDTTQSTNYDGDNSRAEESLDDSDVWGYLIPLDARYTDAIVFRKVKQPTKEAPQLVGGSGQPTKGVSKVVGGSGQGSIESAVLPRYLIGRHKECDVVVDDAVVSNRHCLIFPEYKDSNITAILEDLSTNGTFVNDAIVGRNQTRVLKDQDEISILNKASFIFHYPRSRQNNSFLQQYVLLEKLGKGHFAEVFLCVEKSTGRRYAVKVFTRHAGFEDRTKMEGLQAEIGILMGVNHPNVLCLKDVYNEREHVYMVLDLAPEGELFNYIVMKQKLSENEARKLFKQLFEGIKYLHERNIVHRDVKPENILLMDKELNIKLADFGLAKIIGEEAFTTTLCGTPSYVAPEILADGTSRKYTRAVDIWSLGVVLYICLCGFPPFSDELYSRDFPYTLSQQIQAGRFDYPSPYWDSVGDGALDLIDSMLVVDPNRRLTIDQCLSHPWLNGTAPPKYDSTTALVGSIAGLEINRRGHTRERTLLSSLNTVEVVAEVTTNKEKKPAKVFSKKQPR